MQEEEFKKLLNKCVKGNLTEEEEAILEEFSNELKSKNEELGFKNELERAKIKKSIWLGVQSNLSAKSKKPVLKLVASIAAVFIGLITAGYLYVQNTSAATLDTISKNAITLELEDGRIQVIEEDGSISIKDKSGAVLGTQNGNQLVYTNTNNIEELVFNTLKVPYGKTFEIELSDGTKAYLNAGSSIKYPVKFLKGDKRQVFITGEAYLNVAKDSKRPFIASSEGLNVQVLGTQFNFSAYPEDDVTEVVLVEGLVSLFTDSNGYNEERNIFLKPGLKGSFNRENNNVTTKEVNTNSYISWMSGKLVFRNMIFKNILKKLERHYDIRIVNNNKEIENEVFNANFGNQSLENVLKELNVNYGIKYTTSDKLITIH